MKLDIKKLIEEIKEKTKKDKIIIAIDGDSASGKSILGELLSKNLNCSLIHMDDFYLAKNKDKSHLKEGDGNIDYSRFKEEIINNLNKDHFKYQKFDCAKQELTEIYNIDNTKDFLIIEGSYSLHPYLNKYYDFSIYLNIDKDLQIKRLKERQKDNFNWFYSKWVKLEEEYHNKYQIKENSNKIINVNENIFF